MQAPQSISPHPWLAELTRRMDEFSDRHDERAIHQLRVAAGRLGVWLELAGRRALRDDLRRVRHAVDALRDTDVLLARGHAAENAADLRAARDTAALGAVSAMHDARPRAISFALACVPWPTAAQAEKALRRLGKRAVRAGEDALRGGRDPLRLHRFRRRVRRARYALEWLGRDSTHARELQDALGAWHDATLAELRLAPVASESVDAQRNALERERNALLERALETYASQRLWWRAWIGSGEREWTSS